MIPRVHRGSRTFGGRLRYLSRNGRGENPTEVALENLPDPGGDDNHARLRIAGKVMHSTATNADNLKKLAGGSMRGRRLQQPCHHVTLSWPEGQNPTDAEMIEAGREALQVMDFGDRQAVLFVHRDKNHADLHIITNRVGEDGRAASSSNDAFKLKMWAKGYEERTGGIIVMCRENADRRTIPHEPKRIRQRDGTAVPQTLIERQQWRQLHQAHAADKTPAKRRKQNRTRVGRILTRLGELEATGTDPAPPPDDRYLRAWAPAPSYPVDDLAAELSRRTTPPMPTAVPVPPPPVPSYPVEDLAAELLRRTMPPTRARAPKPATDVVRGKGRPAGDTPAPRQPAPTRQPGK